MATYSDPFNKAAAFWNRYYQKMKIEKSNQSFWDEVISMGKHFDNSDADRKIFVLLIDELERRSKEG